MKRRLQCFFLVAFMGISSLGIAQEAAIATPAPAPTASETPTPQPVSPEQSVTARSKALDLAGAFSNDGFKIRDGHWDGVLEPGKPQLIEVNLFAGNEYWFTAAALSPARKITVVVFDHEGRPVDTSNYEDGPSAAAGLVSERSGPYYIQVDLTEGERADFCFLYCYK